MKILLCYPNYPSTDTYGNVQRIWLNHISKLNSNGFQVKPFCISINPPSFALLPLELDRLWKEGHKDLFLLYRKLEEALSECDVLLNITGVNLHPEFVQSLNVFTVFQFNDDPENNVLSRYMAPAYDLCLVGNIAEVETYKSWGVENVYWMPIGLQPHLYDHALTYERIISEARDIDLFMMIDRLSKWRKERLNKFNDAFPEGHFYGRGWPRGYLDPKLEIEYLLRSKISPNFHNSTGPINYRTFYAPANGSMLICDNKKHLGHIYELGKEAVGFDSVEECIELCHYYLKHEEERKFIAANGWKRAVTDYNEIAVFKRTVDLIDTHMTIRSTQKKQSSVVNKHLTDIQFSKYRARLDYGSDDLLRIMKRLLLRFKQVIYKFF